MAKTIMDGVKECCEDAVAKLNEAETKLLNIDIPERELNALYATIVQTQYSAAGCANKAASIGLDLKT